MEKNNNTIFEKWKITKMSLKFHLIMKTIEEKLQAGLGLEPSILMKRSVFLYRTITLNGNLDMFNSTLHYLDPMVEI